MADKNAGGQTMEKAAAVVVADVMQVGRQDYPALAPVNGKRTQPMRGFEDSYTDIVEYIVRCTHRIWNERDTIQRLVAFPRAARHGNTGDLERR